MTLIAIATYGKYAEFITDTMSYNKNVTEFGRTTKARLWPHLDAAVLTQGDQDFGIFATAILSGLTNSVADFDALIPDASKLLREGWRDESGSWHGSESTVFLVGYSPATDSFRAFSFANDRDEFESEELVAPHVMPAPFGMAPSSIELDRLTLHLEGQVDAQYMHALTVDWPNRSPLAAPRNRSEWLHLAKLCREQRAEDVGRTKTLVGGDIHHTRLARGKVSTHRIHTFDDTGKSLEKLLAGSLSPIAQRAPCACGSGRTYRECCLVQHLGSPCNCDSGRTLGECCAIEVPDALAGVN